MLEKFFRTHSYVCTMMMMLRSAASRRHPTERPSNYISPESWVDGAFHDKSETIEHGNFNADEWWARDVSSDATSMEMFNIKRRNSFINNWSLCQEREYVWSQARSEAIAQHQLKLNPPKWAYWRRTVEVLMDPNWFLDIELRTSLFGDYFHSVCLYFDLEHEKKGSRKGQNIRWWSSELRC